MTGYGAGIFDRHADMLRASAISADVAAERGYVSVDTKRQLPAAFEDYQRRTPGLLIPVHDTSGAVALWQYRPDRPRGNGRDKLVKYETPGGTRMTIDVPPRIRDQLADPKVPLWVTEGIRKADAAVSAGLCCIALLGVWNWCGTNTLGGKTALPAWHDIALNGRRMVLAFDSDVTAKRSVQTALRELAAYLASKGATVDYLHLPAGDQKTGLEDYLAADGAEHIWELVRPDPPALADDRPPATPRAITAHLHTPPPWAADHDICARLVGALRVCGLVGEEHSAQLIYLAVESQMLGDPVSVAVKGLSSSGKSFTVDTVLRFVPPEALIVMTAMSERALVYMDEEFAHRTLVLYEATALREEREKTDSNMTAYIVRSLLSEGRIRYPVTVKGSDGQWVTRTIVRDGPTNMIVTTTATSLHTENETRMLSLPADESEAQTRAVLAALAARKQAEPDYSEWHDYHRWLATANHRVTIPYASWLASQVPPVAVRLRRDFRSVLRLIETHAIMHQLTRATDDAGRIIATEADYLAVRALTADLISDAIGATVLPATREAVAAVADLCEIRPGGATVHDLAAELRIERSAAQRRLKAARERGYLKNTETKRGKPARYEPDEPLPGEITVLPKRVCGAHCTPPCTGHCEGPTGQDGVCRCASTAEETERRQHDLSSIITPARSGSF